MNLNIKQFQVYDMQISGKQPKLVIESGAKILKGRTQKQANFYKSIQNTVIGTPPYHLLKYIPKFYGQLFLQSSPIIAYHQQQQPNSKKKQWLDHLCQRYHTRNPENNFIILENLTYRFSQVNAFDIKIGDRNQDGKQQKITQSVKNYCIKLNGINVRHKNKVHFISKYHLGKVSQSQDIINNFAFFFFDGQKILIDLIKRVIEILKEISLAIRCCNQYKFISSSIYITYDSKDHNKLLVNMIDFGRVKDSNTFDIYTVNGIQNIINFLYSVCKKQQQLTKILKSEKIEAFHYQEVVPQKKIKKYNGTIDPLSTK